MPRRASSPITVKARDTYIMELGVSVKTCRRQRKTETAAIDRIAFGDAIAASNAAALLNKVDLLKCSDCRKEKHFLQFPQCKTHNHRHGGRGYQCLECVSKRREALKRQGLRGVLIDAQDEAYLRSKPNNRRRRNNLNEQAQKS